jgi:hypothetical protein
MTQGFNVGSDQKLTILVNGAPLRATILTDFNSKQMVAEIDSVASDGVNRFRSLEKGWDIDMTFDRADSTIDDFIAAKEAARYSGQQPPEVVVTQRIRNADGSSSRYRYEGIALRLDDAGSWKGDGKVEQKLSGKASRRIKVS